MIDDGMGASFLVSPARAPGLDDKPCRPPEQAIDDGLFIDNFAGGGGASTGIEMAIGRSPDVAINHDAEAVALHARNHPETLHLCQNVWKADPIDVVREASARRCAKLGIPFRMLRVRGLWFSPDCKHFSKAKGSKPVEKGIRDLAWVVVHWVERLQKAGVPVDQIWLENVEEFKDWGPLILTDDGKRVPCPVSKGVTFKRWCRELRRRGGKVEHRELRAFRYGAPTIRKRLFVIVRFDGRPIVWPEPTHEKPNADGTVPGGLLPWRTAAECIDWSIPCPSIFTRERPLAENTLRRIARGIMRYVVNAERPFIVSSAHGGTTGRAPYAWPAEEPLRPQKATPEYGVVEPFVAGVGGRMGQSPERSVTAPFQTITAKGDSAVVAPVIARIGQTGGGGKYANAVDEPVTTITSKAEHILIAPHITKFRANSDGHAVDEPMHTVTANSFVKRPGGAAPIGLVSAVLTPRYGEREGQAPRARSVEEPMASVVPTQNGAQLVAAFLAQHNTGNDGHTAEEPVSTIVGKGCTQGLVAATLTHSYTSNTAGGNGDPETPAKTITTGGHHGLVQVALSPDDQAGAERVAAFIAKYYGIGTGSPCGEPLHAVTTKDRFGLVTVNGWPIVDIGMRMLQPRELYRAQGFPDSYVIDGPGPTGKPLTKTAQVRMCGNSVCPPVAAAIVRANMVRVEAPDVRAAD